MAQPFIRLALILALVLNAAALHGQTTEEDASRRADAQSGRHLAPVGGLRYGPPLGGSIYGGVILTRRDPTGLTGPSLVGEVGQDGMRVSAGVSSVSLAGTFRAHLAVIRTWDDHGDVRADQTYVGPDVAVGIIAGVTLGHYWRISDGGGAARVFSIGSFIGF
jgi:hypothetical protein